MSRALSGAAKTNKRPITHRGAGFGVLRDGEPKEPTIFREDDLPVETRKTFMDLGYGDCRWPGANSFFCGAQSEPGHSWCPQHCARAFRRYPTTDEAETLAR